jgi:CSLREA domain-containing protein
VETDDQTVGLFEGARYLSSGMYRPGDWCLMRVLGQEFCPIAAQSYVLRLYNGSWGMPWEGIDIIEPGTEFPAPGNVFATEPVQFGVDLLQPVGGPPLEVQWYVDGLAEPGASSDGFLFNPPGPGTYTVSLDVADPTELVHTAMAYGALRSSRSWTVVVTGDGIVGDADCDNEVDAVDALFALRFVAGMEPFADCIGLANVKCDDGMTSVDALFILRYVVVLPVNLPSGCDPIGPPLAAFTVNSTLDPGNAFCDTAECTLREAMNAANSHPGPDTIEFSSPPSDPGCDANICTIVPTDYLPVLSDNTGGTTIDGYTQLGATPNSAPPGPSFSWKRSWMKHATVL